jgi:4-amino-4-deoxy-L-arabinose transferase-like glycosyltransferase
MKFRIPHSVFRNRYLLTLLILAGALFFFKLGSFSLYDAAESTYGEFIKQIRLTGDWITLHYNAEIIFDKPPLYFWLAAMATYVFSLNEFAIRFWSAFSGVLLVLTTYFLGKSFYNQRTGFLSAIIVMTSFQFLIQSRIAELDVLLVLLLTLSFLFFWKGYKTKKPHSFWLFYVCLALAALTKGIIGIALPATAIFLFLLMRKELKFILKMEISWGLLILFLLGAPWYLAEWILHGQKFTEFILGFLFLSRFKGVVAGHPGPWYYYFLALILGFAPWSHFLPYSLWKTWKNRIHPPELLSLCYIIPVFLVFSIAKTKLPNYILPLYPFLAIMVGKLWSDFLGPQQEEMRRGMTIANLLLAVVVAMIIVGFIMLGTSKYSGPYQELGPDLIFLAGILLAGSLASIFYYIQKRYQASFGIIPIMVFGIALVLTISTLPQIEKYKGVKDLAGTVNKVIKQRDQIAAYKIGNRPSVVYYSARPVVFLEDEIEFADFLRGMRGYCFTTQAEYRRYRRFVDLLEKKGDLVVIY